MQRKKILRFLLTVCLIVWSISTTLTFVSCKNTDNGDCDIVCTLFPQYDFCRQIMGTDENIKLLLNYGTDAHNYELTLSDKVAIKNSKAFFYIGGESEKWVNKLFESDSSIIEKSVNLSEGLDLIPINHSHEETEDEHEDLFDEHVFLSIKKSILMCEKIKDKICSLYPEKKNEYEHNFEEYVSELNDLDNLYDVTIKGAKSKTIIVADRFPFVYTARDYGLDYYAAFDGCSTDSEISISTKSMLKTKYEELNLPGVFIIENGNVAFAESVMENRKGKIFKLHSCQTITKEESINETYISLMKRNLDALSEGLN